MSPDLLAQASVQAARSEPAVRAAALMRIARVQSASDPKLARTTFEQGLEETRRIPGQDREFLLEQARLLAAAVAPDLLESIAPASVKPYEVEQIGRIMLQHEHGDAAFDYVMNYHDPSTFPFPVVSQLIEWYGDRERQLALFRRAIEVWRPKRSDRFIWLFQHHWKILPAKEASEVVREIVRAVLEQPDTPITATYDSENSVTITSARDHTLFQILHVLRRLDGPLAESLIASHHQLAAAARRYPNGMDTILEEAEARSKNAGETCGGGYVMGGSRRDFPYLHALMQASRDGDFAPPLEYALERYRDDTAPHRPNPVPREFWPSTCHLRSILYRAGQSLGPESIQYLDRIPDPDLRLFAQIELAAALAGLPEMQGTQREFRPRSADLRRDRFGLQE